jgi:hypothetical protein
VAVFEVIYEDELAPVVTGQNQIGGGLLEMGGKQESCVIDLDMIRRRLARSRQADSLRVSFTIEVAVTQHPWPSLPPEKPLKSRRANAPPAARDVLFSESA